MNINEENTKNNVKIKILGSNEFNDPIEIVTMGNYYKKDNKYYVTYKESELTGLKGTTTMVKIENEKVTINRFGTNSTIMIFEKDKSHTSIYQTPYGDMEIGICAENLEVNVDKNGGKVTANYQMKFNNADNSYNKFSMEILGGNI